MLRVLHPRGSQRRLYVVTRHHTFSDTAARRVVSRRAWQKYLEKNPPPKQAPTPPKEEKPWPKSLQIAGYTMAAIFIPYSVAWFMASNGSARALVNSRKLDDLLRHHFGEEEVNVVSYYDVQQGEEVQYQLDGEPSFRERLQQGEIESLNESDLKVRVRVDDQDDYVETVVAGTTLARPLDILKVIGKKDGSIVAVDFGNVVENGATMVQGGDELMAHTITSLEQDTPVTRQTNIYSLWFYVSSLSRQQESKPRMSPSDVEIARLEHAIKVLQSDLNDVRCTRDRDDMVRELNESKAALRSLKWKRRLGFSS